MRERLYMMALAIVAALTLAAPAARAQVVVDRVDDDTVMRILRDMERNADRFRGSLDRALDASAADGSNLEDEINGFVRAFERATDRLEERYDDDNQAPGLVSEVLERADAIDNFVVAHPLSPQARSDWGAIRANLDDLARAYNVTWTWDGAAVVSRVGDDRVRALLSRIESQADGFRGRLDSALDRSAYNGTAAEDEINRYIHDFERATDRWESRFGDDSAAAAEATEVLRRAQLIDDFMASHELDPGAHAAWASLRATLDELAAAYTIAWTW